MVSIDELNGALERATRMPLARAKKEIEANLELFKEKLRDLKEQERLANLITRLMALEPKPDNCKKKEDYLTLRQKLEVILRHALGGLEPIFFTYQCNAVFYLFDIGKINLEQLKIFFFEILGEVMTTISEASDAPPRELERYLKSLIRR